MTGDREAFVARYGPLFEHSAWVAEDAYANGPYADRAALYEGLVEAMYAAPRERQVALVRAHPELAGKVATADSEREQSSAGLDRLSREELATLTSANAAYREKFGFPFVICVRDHDQASILAAAQERLRNDPDTELRTALAEIARIAHHRLEALPRMRISYGKLRVPLQRVVKRADGEHDVLAAEVSIEVLGENFTAAYTEGDNSAVVATDTMKNFILRESLAYAGDTLEGLLLHLGRGFLATYPMMEAVRMTGREHRFDRLGGKLFARESGDHAVAMVELGADGIRDHRSGREDLRLLKVTGSAFTRFARDEYTTLPERVDRPLLIRMDVHWRYGDPEAAHVDPWAVREDVAATFDDFVSESIQHLVHEMGTRMLARWPELAEVSFAAENHTRDPAGEDGDRKLYTDPFPAQGLITLTLTR